MNRLRTFLSVLVVLTALQSTLVNAGPSPSPAVVPGINREYTALLPTRPSDSTALKVTVGTFIGYYFDAHHLPLMMMISLKDDHTGAVTNYLLSPKATVDGVLLKCPSSPEIKGTTYCGELPKHFVAGKTRLALLYWPASSSKLGIAGTDTILVLDPN